MIKNNLYGARIYSSSPESALLSLLYLSLKGTYVYVSYILSCILDYYYTGQSRILSSWKKVVSPSTRIKCRDTIQSMSASDHLLACGLQNGEVKQNIEVKLMKQLLLFVGPIMVSVTELSAECCYRPWNPSNMCQHRLYSI